jgi:hypothetical protein
MLHEAPRLHSNGSGGESTIGHGVQGCHRWRSSVRSRGRRVGCGPVRPSGTRGHGLLLGPLRRRLALASSPPMSPQLGSNPTMAFPANGSSTHPVSAHGGRGRLGSSMLHGRVRLIPPLGRRCGHRAWPRTPITASAAPHDLVSVFTVLTVDNLVAVRWSAITPTRWRQPVPRQWRPGRVGASSPAPPDRRPT